MIPQVRDFTKQFYGFDGLRFPHACGYSGKEREAIPGAFRYMYMQSASGLIANIAWWQYEFTQDREDLERRIYPIVKGAAQFYVNYMTRGTDGRYHIYPTFSPEQKPSLWSRDATIDLAMARYTLRAAIQAADILGMDAKRQTVWKDRLENIAPYPMDAVGIQEMEGDRRDYLFGHTAILHCVHPAAEYRIEQPVYRDLLKQTQDRLGLYDGATFSKAHLAISAAWLHQSNKAWDFLYDGVLAMYLKPNGFVSLNRVSPERNTKVRDNLTKQGAAGAIFQDVSAGAVGTVNEMLLQSQLGSIHVFPALPKTVDAAFELLRARGAFLVSSARRQGAVQFVEVQAVSGGVMKLVNPWPEGDVVSSDPRIQWPSGQDVLELPMAVGQRITFHSAGMIPPRTIWSGRPATAPRSAVRVIQEKMPAGRRNDPLKPLIKYADQCTIWLGKPKAKMPEE